MLMAKKKVITAEEKARWVFSQFTLLLTIGFGAVTTLSLLDEPSRTMGPDFISLASTAGRGPASVPDVSVTLAEQKPFISTVDLGCDAREELKTTSEHIRLKSFNCKNLDSKPEGTTVKNESNGFKATVFYQDNKGFTTDYLALVKGENRILIESKKSDGSIHSREVLVIKE